MQAAEYAAQAALKAMQQELLARARAMCLAAGGSPAMCDEAAAMALAMKKCLASGRSVEDCKAEAIKACMAKGLSKQQCMQAAGYAAQAALEAMQQELLARARAMCLAAGGSPAMCDEAAAMALAMKKCLASGRSVEDCKAEAIKACMAKGLSKQHCMQAAGYAAQAALKAMQQELLARARAMCLAAGGSPAMCDEAAAMALAMKKCLASGRSVEDCKAEAIKACMAKGLSKQQCMQAAGYAAQALQDSLGSSAAPALPTVAPSRMPVSMTPDRALEDEKICLSCLGGYLIDMAVAYQHCVNGNRYGCAKYKKPRELVTFELNKTIDDAEQLKPSHRNEFEQIKLGMLSVLSKLDAMHTSCSAATLLSSCASFSTFEHVVNKCQQFNQKLHKMQPELDSRQSAGQSSGVEYTTLAQVMHIHACMDMSVHASHSS